jgi:hypothetical protein
MPCAYGGPSGGGSWFGHCGVFGGNGCEPRGDRRPFESRRCRRRRGATSTSVRTSAVVDGDHLPPTVGVRSNRDARHFEGDPCRCVRGAGVPGHHWSRRSGSRGAGVCDDGRGDRRSGMGQEAAPPRGRPRARGRTAFRRVRAAPALSPRRIGLRRRAPPASCHPTRIIHLRLRPWARAPRPGDTARDGRSVD